MRYRHRYEHFPQTSLISHGSGRQGHGLASASGPGSGTSLEEKSPLPARFCPMTAHAMQNSDNVFFNNITNLIMLRTKQCSLSR